MQYQSKSLFAQLPYEERLKYRKLYRGMLIAGWSRDHARRSVYNFVAAGLEGFVF